MFYFFLCKYIIHHPRSYGRRGRHIYKRQLAEKKVHRCVQPGVQPYESDHPHITPKCDKINKEKDDEDEMVNKCARTPLPQSSEPFVLRAVTLGKRSALPKLKLDALPHSSLTGRLHWPIQTRLSAGRLRITAAEMEVESTSRGGREATFPPC